MFVRSPDMCFFTQHHVSRTWLLKTSTSCFSINLLPVVATTPVPRRPHPTGRGRRHPRPSLLRTPSHRSRAALPLGSASRVPTRRVPQRRACRSAAMQPFRCTAAPGTATRAGFSCSRHRLGLGHMNRPVQGQEAWRGPAAVGPIRVGATSVAGGVVSPLRAC